MAMRRRTIMQSARVRPCAAGAEGALTELSINLSPILHCPRRRPKWGERCAALALRYNLSCSARKRQRRRDPGRLFLWLPELRLGGRRRQYAEPNLAVADLAADGGRGSKEARGDHKPRQDGVWEDDAEWLPLSTSPQGDHCPRAGDEHGHQ